MRMKVNAYLPCLSALLAAALVLSGCASHSYMGVSLKPGGADPAVQALAVRASAGDKQAQYELGRWFEDSTDADGLKKAIKLYRQAASDSGGPLWVYTPSPGGGASGRVIQVEAGSRSEGLSEARARLDLLQAKERENNMSDNESFLIQRTARPDSLRSYGDYPRQYLLRVSEVGSDTIHLAVGNFIGRDEQGSPIILESDIRAYGKSITASYGPGLTWRGQVPGRKVDFDQYFHSFSSVILTSPKIKEIIESENIPNIEFIPMRIFYKNTDEFIGHAWAINVFNWKDVFDFDNSDVITNENPFGEMLEDRISSCFGSKRIIDWDFLKVNVDETQDGLFLAKGPGYHIWKQIYISKPLADKIRAAVNPSLPMRDRIGFRRFSMNRFLDQQVGFDGQPAEFDHGYQYAGWTGNSGNSGDRGIPVTSASSLK
jgi:hypothetical protein